MKEYIEREAAMDFNFSITVPQDKKIQVRDAVHNTVKAIAAYIEAIPAADVVEVRHGRWIDSEEDGHLSICGVCNYPVDRFYKTKYCPNCGAKMDGGADK